VARGVFIIACFIFGGLSACTKNDRLDEKPYLYEMRPNEFERFKGLTVGEILGLVSDTVHHVGFLDRDDDPYVLGSTIITLDSGYTLKLYFDTIFFQSPYNNQFNWNVDSLMLETPSRILVRRGFQLRYDSFYNTEP
jgi:hypothetical protein